MPNHRPEDGPKETSRIIHESVGRFRVIELVGHAQERMKLRGISDYDIVMTLRNPTVKGLPTQPGRLRVRWNKTMRVAIEVVYQEHPDRIVVITALKHIRRISGR